MQILEVDRLSKEFTMHLREGARVPGFSDISFTLEEGTFLGIRGPSGIGKSSLLKCIYRTYTPSSGAIWFSPVGNDASSGYTARPGERVDLASADEHEIIGLRKREIGYISQFFHVIPRITTVRTVAKVLRSLGHGERESEDRAKELLARLRIPESLWNLFPSTFSGGEKQRVNIICAAVREPRLLLLDEPTASLDAASAEEVMRLIEELKEQGTAMIGVFHNPDHLVRLSDVVFPMPLHADSVQEEARYAQAD